MKTVRPMTIDELQRFTRTMHEQGVAVHFEGRNEVWNGPEHVYLRQRPRWLPRWVWQRLVRWVTYM